MDEPGSAFWVFFFVIGAENTEAGVNKKLVGQGLMGLVSEK